MALEFKLPDIGEGIAEAEIVGWFVAVGDAVEEFQPVVEVMTDKTVVEIPAPAAGTVREIRAAVGDTIPVGQVIFVLDGAAAGKGTAAAPEKAAPAKAAPEKAASGAAASAKDPAPRASAAAPPREGRDRVLAVPSARRVARELDVDLAAVAGTGRNGVIRSADVRAFAEGGGRRATPPPPAWASHPSPSPPGRARRARRSAACAAASPTR